MAIARGDPYLWTSWLTKFLSGEAHCEWALWFRAHYNYEKLQRRDFDSVAWGAQHAVLLRQTVEALRAEGYNVSVEDQNRFAFEGRVATLGGKPDIVATRGDEVIVIDCKTGAQRGSDCWQVLVYMLALPYVRDDCKGKIISGEVRYQDFAVPIHPEELTPTYREWVTSAILRAAGEAAPFKTPSFGECKYCDISKADCPERVDAPPGQQNEPNDLF